MDIFDFRDFCLSLPLAVETTPFDEDTLVMKIGGKMFAYTGMAEFGWICLKAVPEEIPDLIERHPEIGPPVHMSKGHWISVDTGGDLPDAYIKQLIRNSYRLVVRGMTKKQRTEIMEAIGGQASWLD